MPMAADRSFDPDTITESQSDTDVAEPSLYKVLILNDHYTTMDFVVEVIRTVFHKTAAEATKIMLDVHRSGKGIVGFYPLDIARTKVMQVEGMARAAEFPLVCTLEKE